MPIKKTIEQQPATALNLANIFSMKPNWTKLFLPKSTSIWFPYYNAQMIIKVKAQQC
jgi:hypothetical protein